MKNDCLLSKDQYLKFSPEGNVCQLSNQKGICLRGQCKATYCGDGFTDTAAGEECDDQNQIDDDACNNNCKLPNCGDGVIQDLEECDDGNTENSDACLNSCKHNICGDGYTDLNTEECDDGNTENSDACLSTCINSSCGDGFLQVAEECDDGNANNRDFCSNSCMKAYCGDGIIQENEVCDDGNEVSGDGCRSDCLKVETCGDGLKDENEACDDGNENENDSCDRNCHTINWDMQIISGLGKNKGNPLKKLFSPGAMAKDLDGNIYFYSQFQVFRFDAVAKKISTIAGTGKPGRITEEMAAIDSPVGKIIDIEVAFTGNIYLLDQSCSCVHQIKKADQKIRTIIGEPIFDSSRSYSYSSPDGELASQTSLQKPTGIAVDGLENLYIVDAEIRRIRFVDHQSKRVSTFLEESSFPFVRGESTTSYSDELTDIYIDQNNGGLYVTGHNEIWAVSPELEIHKIAGRGHHNYNDETHPDYHDFQALDANIGKVQSLIIKENGNLIVLSNYPLELSPAYIGPFNMLYEYDVQSKKLLVVGGVTNEFDFSEDGVDVKSMTLNKIEDIIQCQNKIFMSGEKFGYIRFFDVLEQKIQTLVGVGNLNRARLEIFPKSIELKSVSALVASSDNIVYFADAELHYIYRYDASTEDLSIYAGSGVGFSYGMNYGDNGEDAREVLISHVTKLSISKDGDLLFFDKDRAILRKIDKESHQVETILGSGDVPYDVAEDPHLLYLGAGNEFCINNSGEIHFIDIRRERILKLSTDYSEMTAVLGNLTDDYQASISSLLTRTVADAKKCFFKTDNELYLTTEDGFDSFIWKINISENSITQVAGGYRESSNTLLASEKINDVAAAGNPIGLVGDILFKEGKLVFTSKFLESHSGETFSVDTGVFSFDENTQQISRLNAVSSSLPVTYGDGLLLNQVTFAEASGLTKLENGDMIIADSKENTLRRLGRDGKITTIVGNLFPTTTGNAINETSFPGINKIFQSQDNLFASSGEYGQIYQYNFTQNSSLVISGYLNGLVSLQNKELQAKFANLLENASGIAYDESGKDIYISEKNLHVIKRLHIEDFMHPENATIGTWAGKEGESAHNNSNVASEMRFNSPAGLDFDPIERALYIADSGNQVIRKIFVDSESSSTIAGKVNSLGFYGENVEASKAIFNSPQDIHLTNRGYLYIADTGNHRVRMLDPLSGLISTVIGDGVPSSSGHGFPAINFPIDSPDGLSSDRYGNLFITSKNTIREVFAGVDGVADYSDIVRTIYGNAPRAEFPESITLCLSDVIIRKFDQYPIIVDQCQGYMIELKHKN